jgi:hypothetical protein
MQVLSWEPRIFLYHDFLTHGECPPAPPHQISPLPPRMLRCAPLQPAAPAEASGPNRPLAPAAADECDEIIKQARPYVRRSGAPLAGAGTRSPAPRLHRCSLPPFPPSNSSGRPQHLRLPANHPYPHPTHPPHPPTHSTPSHPTPSPTRCRCGQRPDRRFRVQQHPHQQRHVLQPRAERDDKARRGAAGALEHAAGRQRRGHPGAALRGAWGGARRWGQGVVWGGGEVCCEERGRRAKRQLIRPGQALAAAASGGWAGMQRDLAARCRSGRQPTTGSPPTQPLPTCAPPSPGT